ncbi:hypothetical protein WJX73_007166 [Symbiochloris irregularis]|uniref:RING-type domain-containing protein n=1 Tax=Symbiochloris irregularis TaxID=706552 RepID=A0AAW1PC51_9CHLO
MGERVGLELPELGQSRASAGLIAGEFECSICKSTLQDPFVTSCGHTFCYACLNTHLQHKNVCPACSSYLSKDHAFPNFLLGKVSKQVATEQGAANKAKHKLQDILQDAAPSLQAAEVEALLRVLTDRKQDLQQQQQVGSLELLRHFLQHSREHKAQRLQDLQGDLQILDQDIARLQQSSSAIGSAGPYQAHLTEGAGRVLAIKSLQDSLQQGLSLQQLLWSLASQANAGYVQHRLSDDEESSEMAPRQAPQTETYRSFTNPPATTSTSAHAIRVSKRRLASQLKVITHISQTGTRQSTSILSSIDFDRDALHFATAGVSKRISIYDFEAVVGNAGATTHRPTSELLTRSKLSCLAWSAGEAAHMISSDYEGLITLWDVASGNAVSEYEAHERRIWSIDFCKPSPDVFASGSDDGCVRVWSTQLASHVSQIPVKANVCCVSFSPTSAHSLAVASADHNVHLYDLRAPGTPVHVFSGHRKAVSHVQFNGQEQVVSASTDSTLRLWDMRDHAPVRTYSGHVNEKNFVGLSVNGDFIACGSETNEVFVYHSTMSKPLTHRLFAPPAAQTPAQQDASQFISAVAWRPASTTLLAASSQGAIRVMQLSE